MAAKRSSSIFVLGWSFARRSGLRPFLDARSWNALRTCSASNAPTSESVKTAKSKFRSSAINRARLTQLISSFGNEIDWERIAADALREKPNSSREDVFLALLKLCKDERLIAPAESLFCHLHRRNEISHKVLYVMSDLVVGQEQQMDRSKDVIFGYFQEKIKESDSFSLFNVAYCLRILLQFEDYWEKALKLYRAAFPDVKEVAGATFACGLRFRNPDLALESLRISNVITHDRVNEFLDYCSGVVRAGGLPSYEIGQFLEILHERSYCCRHVEVLEKFNSLFRSCDRSDEKYAWSAEMMKMTTNKCPVCSIQFQLCDVTAEEIGLLRDAFEKHGVIKNNIFIKTDNKEWTRFLEFVNSSDYNFVLDGLNFNYGIGRHGSFVHERLLHLLNACKRNNFKVLIIGRKHFIDDIRKNAFIKNNSLMFVTQNTSDDDVFVIYAALSKGPECYVASRDHLRGYNANLNGGLYDVFKRWQISRQYTYTNTGSLVRPLGLRCDIQRTEVDGGDSAEFRYHIPLIINDHVNVNEGLCARRLLR